MLSKRSGGELAHEREPHIEPITCTVRDAARISGLGTSTLWKLISEGKLETLLIYKRRLVVIASLRKLLAQPEAEA